MNNSEIFRIVAGLVLAGLLSAAPLLLTGAQNEPAVQDKAAPPGDAQKPGGQTQGQAGDAASPDVQTPASETPAVKEFKPTEKIGADSAVAFPVDI